MARPSRGSVKVVLIDTKYVKADPTSFKSVVQSLTGRDSCVAWVENSAFNGISDNTNTSTSTTTCHEIMNKREMRPDHNVSSTNNVGSDSSIMFSGGNVFQGLGQHVAGDASIEGLAILAFRGSVAHH